MPTVDDLLAGKELRGEGGVVYLSTESTLEEAFQVLSRNHILSAPVSSEPGTLTVDTFVGFVDVLSLVSLVVSDFLRDERITSMSPLQMWDEFHAIGSTYLGRKVSELVRGGAHSEPVWLARSTSTLLDLLRHGFGFGGDKQPKRRLPLFATDGKIRSIVSQTDVLRYVNKHMSLLGTMASATVRDVGLGSDNVVVVGKDEIAVKAFALMKEKHVSALGVVDAPKSAIVDSRMVTGTMVTNLSASDLRGVSFDDFGTLAKPVEHFLLIAKSHRATLRHLPEPVTLSMSNTVADVVHKLISSGVHRVYIVDEAKHPVRVVSQTDVLELLYAVLSGNAAPVS